MSNYSKQESKNAFGVTSEINDIEYRKINDIEVKVKPKSFENDKEKIASVGYVNKIIEKLCADLNKTLIPDLNHSFHEDMEELVRLHEGFSGIRDAFSNNSDYLIDNNKEYRTWTEELSHLKREVEGLKAAIIDHNDVKWEAPASSDIL